MPPPPARTLEVATGAGPARAVLRVPRSPRALLVLGHGAGGGIEAPDLVAVTRRVVADGVAVALVEQPYRLAGRRAPAPAPQLDVAFRETVALVRAEDDLAGAPLYVGGRSSGARVACRTAAAVDAAGAVCLAFPLHPPGRPDRSRVDELRAAKVPVLVVQGGRDAFGAPAEFAPLPAGVTLVPVPGDHALKADVAAVADVVAGWLAAGAHARVRG